jgi:hypothetical protein
MPDRAGPNDDLRSSIVDVSFELLVFTQTAAELYGFAGSSRPLF